VVSSDRGLCGGLNINLFKQIVRENRYWKEQGVNTEFCLIGTKAVSFFKSVGGKVESTTNGLGDNPHLTDLIGSIKVMLDTFEKVKLIV